MRKEIKSQNTYRNERPVHFSAPLWGAKGL